MNERIKELAEEAGRWCYNNYDIPTQERFQAKFAELIVRECLGCCEQVISDPVPKSIDTWLNCGSQCIEEIKHTFGI